MFHTKLDSQLDPWSKTPLKPPVDYDSHINQFSIIFHRQQDISPYYTRPFVETGCRMNFNTKFFKPPALYLCHGIDSKHRKEVAKRWISHLFNCQIFGAPGLTSYYWQASFPPKLQLCGMFLCDKIWLQVKTLLANLCGKNGTGTVTLSSPILTLWFSHLHLRCQDLVLYMWATLCSNNTLVLKF